MACMRFTLTVLASFLILASSYSSPLAAEPVLETDEQKTLYALGLAVSRSLAPFSLTPDEFAGVQAGISDGVLGADPKVNIEEWGPKVQALSQTRQTMAAEVEKVKSTAFLEKMAAEDGATKTESGLVYRVLTAGSGDSPAATDKVKVHYHGTLRDGTVFDSSVDRGQPATFPLNGVIKCWTEGVQLMKAGGKSKLTCPAAIAYGDRGSPPKIAGGAALVFEVELLEIMPKGAGKQGKKVK
ncbi:MAG: FKBP-type peptidyl-prolyl cis-trans isomerase FkpA [Hyphomicrobiaceae bacterium]|jgi:FKBP-type peptidyl-prolyl cis-trans isomerase FkpA